MSRWDDSGERVARARIIARYTDLTVLDALRRDHRREGWT